MESFDIMQKQLLKLTKGLGKKQLKQLKIDPLMRLIEKMKQDKILETKIKSEDPQTVELFDRCYRSLTNILSQNLPDENEKRVYASAFKELTKRLAKTYKLNPRGTYTTLYLAIGITFGAGIGSRFIASNPSYYSIAISLGLVFGVAFGNMKEKQELKAGRMY